LSAPPHRLTAIGGGVLLLRGREGMGGEGRGYGSGREGKGGRREKGGEGKGRGLPPLYLTSGYGPACDELTSDEITV